MTYGGESTVGFLDPSGGPQVTMEVSHLQASTKRTGPTSTSGPQVVMTLETSTGSGVSSSSAIVSLEVPTGSIDPNDFESHLDPQSIAALENVLQSDQGREMLTEALGGMGVVAVPDSGSGARWDHDAVVSSSGVGGLVTPMESPSSTTMMSPTNNTPNSTAQQLTPQVHRGPGRPPGRPSSGNTRGGRSTPVATPPSVRKLSESDSANIRRSQRQQDRIERQEAERIREENQQMLQREKEQMQAALQQQSVSPTVSATPSSPPAAMHHQPVNVGIVSSTQVTTPVNSTPATPLSTPSAMDRIDSTSERSEAGSVGSGRRPARNRKLPAHLADPNYLTLDDASSAVKEATRRLSTQQDLSADENISAPSTPASNKGGTMEKPPPPVEPISEVDDEQQQGHSSQDEATEEEEDYTEDDPNRLWCICRQPHNNRFMICCDKCEDWFHGKCVNVTKAQGKAMELKNIAWHCPPCKKALAEEKKMAALAIKHQQRQQKSETYPVPPSSQSQASATASPGGTAAANRRKSGAGAAQNVAVSTLPQQQQQHQSVAKSTISPKNSSSGKMTKLGAAAAAQKAEAEAAAAVAISAEPPRKIAAAAAANRGRQARRRSEKGEIREAVETPSTTTSASTAPPSCASCKRPARSGSAYCSEQCVQKYADNVGTSRSSPVKAGQAVGDSTEVSPSSSTTPAAAPSPTTPVPEQSPGSIKSPQAGAQSKLKVSLT